jgi:hypothetical protein
MVTQEELQQKCNDQLPDFLSAMSKMGMEPESFVYLMLGKRDDQLRDENLESFELSEEEKESVRNRVKLFRMAVS